MFVDIIPAIRKNLGRLGCVVNEMAHKSCKIISGECEGPISRGRELNPPFKIGSKQLDRCVEGHNTAASEKGLSMSARVLQTFRQLRNSGAAAVHDKFGTAGPSCGQKEKMTLIRAA